MGIVAIILLLAFAAWQGARRFGLFDGTETVNQAWFDNYSDRFISEATVVTVNGKANKRMFPTAQGTQVIGYYPNGTRIKGRWVRGADPKILWFRTGDGYYLWEGNLVGDAAVMAKASQAALDPSKSVESESAAAAAPTAVAAARPEPKTQAKPELAASEAKSAEAFDRRILGLIGPAVGDAGLASEIAGNADLVAPTQTAGGDSLIWSMCARRCDYDYSSAVITTVQRRRTRIQVCIHDGRRMSGWSEWYEDGRSMGRKPGLCPSSLLAL